MISKPNLETAVEEIMEVRDDLCNEWEYEFIQSIAEQLDINLTLSEKQEEIVWRIYEKACNSKL